jgi:hypothetical protein
MTFELADDGTFRLSDLHPLELQFLRQVTLVADPAGSPEARRRLYPDPLRRHKEEHGEREDKDDENDEEDWEELVVPGLEKHFESTLEIIDSDLAQTNEDRDWNIGQDEIVVPTAHSEQWYLALNQARLVMAERYQLHPPAIDPMLVEEESEDENEEPTASDSLHEDPPAPKIEILTIIQYEFYGKLQCCLMDLFL